MSLQEYKVFWAACKQRIGKELIGSIRMPEHQARSQLLRSSCLYMVVKQEFRVGRLSQQNNIPEWLSSSLLDVLTDLTEPAL